MYILFKFRIILPQKLGAMSQYVRMCFVLMCIHVREDSVIGSPFNVHWSLLFVLTFVTASCVVFFLMCVFVFWFCFVCVVF